MIQQNRIYKPLYTNTKRYVLLTGGRGSGKSFHAATYLCLLTYEKMRRILFTRYTMTSAEISIIPEFKDKIELLEVEKDFSINLNQIKNTRTDSDILFRGIKTSSGVQTANLKSLANVSCWCNDESEELVDEDLFDTIDLSIRTRDAQNIVILIMNPSDKSHWIYRRFLQNTNRIKYIDGHPVEISTHPDVLHIHTSYFDNKNNLEKSFIESVERMKIEQPKNYAHKIIGQWRDANEGALFSKSELKTYKDVLEFDGSFAFIDVAEDGNDYLCMLVGRNVREKIYITDIIFSDKNSDVTLPMCADAIKRNGVKYCRVESNNMGSVFARNLTKIVSGCMVLPVATTTNKHTRIFMQSVFVNEYFYFKKEEQRGEMYESALNQLCTYTKDGKAKHDDAADAVSGLAIFVQQMLKSYY